MPTGGLRIIFPKPEGKGVYAVVWTVENDTPQSANGAPPDIPMPARIRSDTQIRYRTRGNAREAYHFTERGDCALVGCAIAPAMAGMETYAIKLSFAGLGILILGLGGGWWLTTRSIRPIEEIAGTAQRISMGELSERIPVTDPRSELGKLASVLNSTFTQLEESFTRQKRFTSDASHELRTPLTVLIAETQTALSRPRTADEYQETLVGNLDTARQMKRLAEALLELARLDGNEEKIHSMTFDLAELAQDRVARLRSLAQTKGIHLEEILLPATTLGNPERLGLVITNLIENAIHYGTENGNITIKVMPEHDQSILIVKDDGPGIPPGDIPHIFERFYRGDKARSNSGGRYGLGLAICKGFVEADGGTIQVSSKLGCGTRFTVQLKLTDDSKVD